MGRMHVVYQNEAQPGEMCYRETGGTFEARFAFGCTSLKSSKSPPRFALMWLRLFDFRSDGLETVYKVFVAAINGVHLAKHGSAFSGKHTYKEYRGRTKGRRADELSAT